MGSRLAAAALASCLAFTGCTFTHSTYERPELPEVKEYQDARMFNGAEIEKDFYRTFGDHNLDKVIEEALVNNYDMQTAFINVQKAMVTMGIDQTTMTPTAEASISTESSRPLDYHASSTRLSSSALSLSYIFDLFGKLSAARMSSFQDFKASAYDYLAMRLTTIASAALAYYNYVYSYEALLLGIQDVLDSKKRMDIILYKFTLGAIEGLEYDQAMVDHLNVLQELDSRYNDYDLAHSSLTTIMGKAPDRIIDLSSLNKSVVPNFGTDVPARLLSRRPDLMASEARIKAALSSYDEAVLTFFPEITLSASYSGGESVLFSNFLSNPVGALGAMITFPFLNFNELRLQKDLALLELDQARLDFVNDYIVAVQEVYDAISTVQYNRKLALSSQREYELTKSNYDRYLDKYRVGQSSLSDLLDASDDLRLASITLLAAKRDALVSCIDLMVALGGDTRDGTVDGIPGVGNIEGQKDPELWIFTDG